MFARRLSFVVITSFLLTSSVTALAADSPDSQMTAREVIEQDRERIRAHLESVEQRLRAKDVSHLSPEQQRARARNLDRLHAYWKRGVFPHNDITKEQRPIFIDREGRACAVAHLMQESGWEKQARAISRRENLAYLPNMESPEVTEWVRQSGLTAQEAALIQPTYCHLDVSYGQDNCGRSDTGSPSEDTGDDSGAGDTGGHSTDTDDSANDTGGAGTDTGDESTDVPGDESTDVPGDETACSTTGSPSPGFLLAALLLPAALLRRKR